MDGRKHLLFVLTAVLILAGNAHALENVRTLEEAGGHAELFRELTDAAPDAAADVLEDAAGGGAREFSSGIRRVLENAAELLTPVLRQRTKGAAAVLLAVLLCSALRGVCQDTNALTLSIAGALAVTGLSAGSLEQLIGLGWETIEQLHTFSRALLPTLAAATAASGSVTSATVQQVTAVFLAEALIALMDNLLMPLVYLYTGVLTASCALGEERLSLLAAGLKRIVTAVLTGTLLLFTVYLSVFRVIAGSADAAAVKTTKAAISNLIPVVGGILAETSEAMLAGAGMLRNSIGILGMLAVLAACVYPFLQLGVQYLLYKGAALLASAAGVPELCRLIDGLGGAFGLVLGMTASCAILLLVSILSFLSAAVP